MYMQFPREPEYERRDNACVMYAWYLMTELINGQYNEKNHHMFDVTLESDAPYVDGILN